ncbi:retrotransposon protein, putative, ty1-copia subclass [Tanacetum coccineum]
MHNMGKTIGELHALLIEYEKGLPKKATTPQHPAKDDTCHHYKEVGHWKRNCPAYLVELIKKKKQVGTASSSSARRILNMVPTKKVDKTLYELRYGKVPNLSYLKDPKETMGYYFYFPPKKIVVARYAEFLEKNLISQEVIGRAVELEEIQDEDTSPFENTSEIPYECLDAMNEEMQSIKDNQVWRLVDLPPNSKTIGSKWLFKKKTDMYGIVHTYKSHLVAKRFTQTYEVNYEKMLFADIRAIRILRAIATFYDYEIWQIDVKTAFLNGYFDEDIYMVQPEGFVDPKHLRKVCKLQRSIHGLKQASRNWNKRFDEEIKRLGFSQNLDEPCVYQKASESNVTFLILMDNSKHANIPVQDSFDLNKTQGASTLGEVKCMKNVPYASVVESIMYAVRCTRPDVAFAIAIIMEYLVNISKRRAFLSLNEDILKINDSDNQYAISIKEDMEYPCLHSPKTTKERRSIRRIQERQYTIFKLYGNKIFCKISNVVLTPRNSNTPYLIPWIRRRSCGNNSRNYGAIHEQDRADYGSEVARPKIKDKDNFELKGQFLKELRTNTFIGSDHEDANEHIDKVLEIVDLIHIPNITIDQVMLREFHMSLTGAASRWIRNKPTGSITTWDGLKTKFLNKYCPPARTAKKMKEINNFQQELDENLS